LNIVFNTSDGKPAYMLVKQDPGFELMRYEQSKPISRGKHVGTMSTEGYRKMAAGNGLYPSSLRNALDLIVQDQMIQSDDTIDFKTAVRQLKDFSQTLDIIAENAQI